MQSLVNASLILEGMKERISALEFSDNQKSVLEQINSSLDSIDHTKLNIAKLELEADTMPNGHGRSSHQKGADPADYALSR